MTSSMYWQQLVTFSHAVLCPLLICFFQTSAIICSSLVTVGTMFGLGRSKSSINDNGDLAKAIKYTVIAPAFSLISTTFGKLSALTLLVRLMGMAAERWHLVVLWAICGVMVAFNAFAIVLAVGFCYPASKQWNPSIDGWCMSPDVQYGRSISCTRLPAWASYSPANPKSLFQTRGRLHISCI